MTEPELEACFAQVTALLDRLPTRWALAGARAAMVYREAPRATTDIDALVEWHDALITGLLDEDLEMNSQRDGDEVHFVRVYARAGFVDLMIAATEYQDEALRRADNHILTVEDVLIHKLIAWRLKDRDDIASILSTTPELDRAYLERWVAEWDVTDRWIEAQTLV